MYRPAAPSRTLSGSRLVTRIAIATANGFAPPRRSWFALIALVSGIVPSGAMAQNTWTGLVNNAWNNNGNWTDTVNGVQSGQVLIFGSNTSNFRMNNNAGTLNNLTLDFTQPGKNYSLRGDGIFATGGLSIAPTVGFYLANYSMTGPSNSTIDGTFGGSGTLNTTALTINGTGRVSPGGIVANGSGSVLDTVGTLNVQDITVSPGATYAATIGSFSLSPAPGVDNDLLAAVGTLDMVSGSFVNVNNMAGTTPTDGITRNYIIGTASSVPNATGVTIVPTGFAAGDTFSLSTTSTSLVLSYTPVPEPLAALVVFAAGLGAVNTVVTRRRKRAASVAGMA